VTPKLGVDDGSRSDERHAELEVARRRQRANDDVPRGEIAAHGVHSNPDQQGLGSRD
jgi:hypothetical protein